MRATYLASDNSAGDSQDLGPAGVDIYVRKIIFGNPSDGDVLNLYNKQTAPGHVSGMASVAVTDCVLQVTQPSHAAGCNWVREIDFGNAPLQLDGGSFHTDGSDVTVIWERVDEAKAT